MGGLEDPQACVSWDGILPFIRCLLCIRPVSGTSPSSHFIPTQKLCGCSYCHSHCTGEGTEVQSHKADQRWDLIQFSLQPGCLMDPGFFPRLIQRHAAPVEHLALASRPGRAKEDE